MGHHAWLIFIFIVETELHCVGQASLHLLASSDLPTSASRGAGITGMSDSTLPLVLYLNDQCQRPLLCPLFPLLWVDFVLPLGWWAV